MSPRLVLLPAVLIALGIACAPALPDDFDTAEPQFPYRTSTPRPSSYSLRTLMDFIDGATPEVIAAAEAPTAPQPRPPISSVLESPVRGAATPATQSLAPSPTPTQAALSMPV